MSGIYSTCLNCHSRCATCVGATEADCLTCNEVDLTWDAATLRCIETSPNDGKKHGDYECEDDDTLAGDGCFNGNIEDGWTCSGGTITTPDTCFPLPSVEISGIDWTEDDMTVVFNFSTAV